jgi:hypothetical protein
MEPFNSEDWYSGVEATTRLSQNSQRTVDPSYVRWLAKRGTVKVLKLGPNYSLYDRKTIDSYIVETRGKKAGRTMHERKRKEGKHETNQTAE